MAWRVSITRCQHRPGSKGEEEKWGQERAGRRAHTRAVDVVIWVPPEAPTTIRTLPSLSTMMEGHMDDRGCLPKTTGGDRDGDQLPG